MSDHFEQGAVKLAIAGGLEMLAETAPLPVAIGMIAAGTIIGSIGAVETVMGLGEMIDPESELRDIDL